MINEPTTSFREAMRVFARIGCLSFGGPAGQIALMHRELVEQRPWLSEQDYLRALNFCMLLPGPEAMQLATYAGWRLHGVRGGLMAGLLFVLPGAAVVLIISVLYSLFGRLPLVEAVFFGIKAAVLAIVLEALLKVSRRALNLPWHWMVAIAAFLALFVFNIPFPAVIAVAGITGYVMTKGDAPDTALQEVTPVPPLRSGWSSGLRRSPLSPWPPIPITCWCRWGCSSPSSPS